MSKAWLIPCALLCLLAATSFGQDSLSTVDKILNFPNKVLEKITKKATTLEDKLVSYSEKALAKLEKQEQKLKRKLAKKDSLAALQVFGDIENKYKQLRAQLSNQENKLNRFKEYSSGIDTLKTAMNFLSQHANTLLANNPQAGQLNDALKSVKGFEDKLQGTEAIRKYLKERRQQLKEQLRKFGLAKQFQQYNKRAFYYSQQIREFESILKDPQKRERKAIELITRLPLFQKFFREHSELAALFPLPDNFGTPMALQGLQSRASVQGMIQQQLQSGGPNAQAMMQQNIAAAQNQLRQWKDKVNQLGGMNSDEEIPDFKVNTEKTKSFWKRITYGTDMQNTKGTTFIPSTTDLSLLVGYKKSDIIIFGIGGAYKMGWKGTFNHLTLTHEGVSIRSFIDWKLPKGNFYISGGYEQNYQKQFNNIQQLKRIDFWSQNCLLGISKSYNVGKKWKGNMKLLYDFLYKTHAPQTQPILFRFGYSL